MGVAVSRFAVTAGTESIGAIAPAGRTWRAWAADGGRLPGNFIDRRAAMAAVVAAYREGHREH